MTMSIRLVLEALVVESAQEICGSELATLTGLHGGRLHPVLARLEGMGWVGSQWEDSDPHESGRPAHRFYRLTSAGAPRAAHVLARTQSRTRHVQSLRTAGEQS